MELILDLLLKLVLPAIAASAVGTALAVCILPERWQPLGVAGAMGLGMAAGNYWREAYPYWPEDTGWAWILPVAALALLVSGVRCAAWLQLCDSPSGASARRFEPWSAAVLNAGVTLFAAERLLSSDMHNWRWLVPLVLLVCGATFALERSAARRTNAFSPACWGIILAGGAAVLSILASSARLADGAVMISASLAGVAAVALFRRVDARPLAFVVVLIIAGLMLLGHEYSDVPRLSFVLAAGAPLGLLLLELPHLRSWPPASVKLAIVEALLLAIPMAVAVGMAVAYVGI